MAAELLSAPEDARRLDIPTKGAELTGAVRPPTGPRRSATPPPCAAGDGSFLLTSRQGDHRRSRQNVSARLYASARSSEPRRLSRAMTASGSWSHGGDQNVVVECRSPKAENGSE